MLPTGSTRLLKRPSIFFTVIFVCRAGSFHAKCNDSALIKASGRQGDRCSSHIGLRVPDRQPPVRPNVMAGVAVRYAFQVVLMLRLRFPERACRRHLGHDAPRPQARCVHVGELGCRIAAVRLWQQPALSRRSPLHLNSTRPGLVRAAPSGKVSAPDPREGVDCAAMLPAGRRADRVPQAAGLHRRHILRPGECAASGCRAHNRPAEVQMMGSGSNFRCVG